MAVDKLFEMIADLSSRMAYDHGDLERSAKYYDACFDVHNIGIATPPEMRKLTAAIGWPRLYLDSIEERLDVEGFRVSGSADTDEELSDWWQSNDLDEESSLAHLDALIYGRSYVTIAAPGDDDDEDYPLIRVESPMSMYAEVDPRTHLVTRALRYFTDKDYPERAWATIYLPNETIHYSRGNRASSSNHWQLDGHTVHDLGIVPVVPIYNRERLVDRDGRSEITPEIRTFTDAASRTVMNMQAAAELMAVPQRLIFGVESEQIAGKGSRKEVFDAYMAHILAIEDTDAHAHQFAAAELRNFVDVLEELTKHVAAYTGLPPQYLSFSSENPASAEAIKSSESRLVKKCERKARMFGGSWERVMRIAKRVMGQEITPEMRRLETVWRDPATPTFASKADATSKLYNNGQGLIPLEQGRIDLGYTREQREQMKEWDNEAPPKRLADALAGPASRTGRPQRPGEPAAPRPQVAEAA